MSAGTVDCSYTFMETTDHSKLELETASEMMTETDTASNVRFTLQDSSSDPSLNSDPDPQKEYDTLENTDHFQLEQDTASGMMTETNTGHNIKSTLQEMNTGTETNIASVACLFFAAKIDCAYNTSEVINE